MEEDVSIFVGLIELLQIAAGALAVPVLWLYFLVVSVRRLIVRPRQEAKARAVHATYPRRAFWRTWCWQTSWRALVVAIIIAPAGMPLLIGRIEAKRAYAQEAVPVIANLRTRIEVFRNEEEHLPGLGRNADGSLAQTTRLADGLSGVQTFISSNGVQDYAITEYAAYVEDFSEVVVVTNEKHAFREIDVGYQDLTCRFVRPKHFQYRADTCQGGSRLHTVGAFGIGDNDGLKGGTGYAVMELNNTTAQVKAFGVWKRYKPVAEAKRQIVMVNAEEARRHFNCETPEQARKMNLCWVGDTEALMSGDKARVERALEELRKAGWEW